MALSRHIATGISLLGLTLFSVAGCSPEQPPAQVAEDIVEEQAAETDSAAEASAEESEVDEAPASATYTLEDVAAHGTLEDCWIAVDGVVYDVSGFGPSHPGGASRIEQICGTDATEAFRGQHGTSSGPNSTLAGFEIGVLG